MRLLLPVVISLPGRLLVTLSLALSVVVVAGDPHRIEQAFTYDKTPHVYDRADQTPEPFRVVGEDLADRARRLATLAPGLPAKAEEARVAAKAGTDLVKYDADFALGQLTRGGSGKASELIDFASSQGWRRSQTATGPIKFIDENGVERLVIKKGSSRTAGSEFPHVALRNAGGSRIDPYGNVVTRKSVGNHTPIQWDIP